MRARVGGDHSGVPVSVADIAEAAPTSTEARLPGLGALDLTRQGVGGACRWAGLRRRAHGLCGCCAGRPSRLSRFRTPSTSRREDRLASATTGFTRRRRETVRVQGGDRSARHLCARNRGASGSPRHPQPAADRRDGLPRLGCGSSIRPRGWLQRSVRRWGGCDRRRPGFGILAALRLSTLCSVTLELVLNRQVLEGPTLEEEPALRELGWDPRDSRNRREEGRAGTEQAARFDEESRWRRGRIRDVVAAREVLIEVNGPLFRGAMERGATLERALS